MDLYWHIVLCYIYIWIYAGTLSYAIYIYGYIFGHHPMVYVYVDLILALYPMVYVYMYTGTVSCYT